MTQINFFKIETVQINPPTDYSVTVFANNANDFRLACSTQPNDQNIIFEVGPGANPPIPIAQATCPDFNFSRGDNDNPFPILLRNNGVDLPAGSIIIKNGKYPPPSASTILDPVFSLNFPKLIAFKMELDSSGVSGKRIVKIWGTVNHVNPGSNITFERKNHSGHQIVTIKSNGYSSTAGASNIQTFNHEFELEPDESASLILVACHDTTSINEVLSELPGGSADKGFIFKMGAVRLNELT